MKTDKENEMITNSELSDIETRAKIATPSPWLIHPEPRYYVQMPFSTDEQVKLDRDANAAFVANARDDVPKLVSEVRRLRSVISNIHEQAKYSLDHGLEPANTAMWQIEADTHAELAAAEQGHAADAHTSKIVTYCKDCCGKEVHAATCNFARG